MRLLSVELIFMFDFFFLHKHKNKLVAKTEKLFLSRTHTDIFFVDSVNSIITSIGFFFMPKSYTSSWYHSFNWFYYIAFYISMSSFILSMSNIERIVSIAMLLISINWVENLYHSSYTESIEQIFTSHSHFFLYVN